MNRLWNRRLLLLKVLVHDYFIRKAMEFNGVIRVVAHFANIDGFVWTVNVHLERGGRWVKKDLF